jgi:hypothetical protein
VLRSRCVRVVEKVNHVARRVRALLDEGGTPLQQPDDAAARRRCDGVEHQAHEGFEQAVALLVLAFVSACLVFVALREKGRLARHDSHCA